MRWLVTVVAVLAMAGPLYAADDRDVDRARDSVLDDTYQPQLPDEATWARARSAADEDEAARREREDTRLRVTIGGSSSVVTMVMWGIVIVGGGLLALWLARELLRRNADPELPAVPSRAAQTAAMLERPLDDAEQLARGGAYVEAIHTLLLRTLHELARGADVRVAPAMTSREILARVPLRDDARDALARLIGAVEITHFGDAPADAADYTRCRDQFQVFANAFRREAAA